MVRQVLATLTFALAAGLDVSSGFSQTPPNTTQLQPAPDIPGVIKGGTMAVVVIKGLERRRRLLAAERRRRLLGAARQPHRAAGRTRPARHSRGQFLRPTRNDIQRKERSADLASDRARLNRSSRCVA
jgi:hypothetical protein